MSDRSAGAGSDVSAIVVSYNSADDLPHVVDSMRSAASGLRLQITVVDNDSSDDSVAVARGLGVRCIANQQNLGYAAALNRAWPTTGEAGAYLVVNPDVRFAPDSVRRLYDEAIGSRCVTVPRIIDEHGATRYSLRREPTLGRQAGEALMGDHLPGRSSRWSVLVRGDGGYSQPGWVDWATGAVMMVPAVCAAAVGRWDEAFFLYSEEVDYCRRARSLGYPIRYVPDALVFHEGGGSGASSALVALDALNKVRYFRRHHGPVRTALYNGLLVLEKALRVADESERFSARALMRRVGRAWRKDGLPPGRVLLEQLQAELARTAP